MMNNDKYIDRIALAAMIIAATLLTRKSVAKSWSKLTHNEPPPEQSNQDVDISEAVTWAIVSGITVGLVRLAVRRMAYRANVRS